MQLLLLQIQSELIQFALHIIMIILRRYKSDMSKGAPAENALCAAVYLLQFGGTAMSW